MRLHLIQIPTSHLGAGERIYPLGLARFASLAPPEIDIRGSKMDLNIDNTRSLP